MFRAKTTVDYYEMFRKSSRIVARAALSLQLAIVSGDVDAQELEAIKQIEHEGDKLMHEAMRQIEEAFITPLDQGKMISVLQGLERVTDAVDQIAQHFYMMHVRSSNQYIDKFIALLVRATEATQSLFNIFHEYEHKSEPLKHLILEINQCEEAADQVYREAMYALYGGAFDALEVLRLQTIYTKLEEALDCCEDVADGIEGIIASV